MKTVKIAELKAPKRAFAAIRDRSRTPAHWRISSTELLREERRERSS